MSALKEEEELKNAVHLGCITTIKKLSRRMGFEDEPLFGYIIIDEEVKRIGHTLKDLKEDVRRCTKDNKNKDALSYASNNHFRSYCKLQQIFQLKTPSLNISENRKQIHQLENSLSYLKTYREELLGLISGEES